MTFLSVLLIFVLAVAAGMTVLVIEHLRWEHKNCPRVCTTCGQYHAPGDTHR